MAHKKGDKVLLITKLESEAGHSTEIREVESATTAKVKLKDSDEEFSPKGKSKTREAAIVPMPEFAIPAKSQSVFVRSAKSVDSVSLDERTIVTIFEELEKP